MLVVGLVIFGSALALGIGLIWTAPWSIKRDRCGVPSHLWRGPDDLSWEDSCSVAAQWFLANAVSHVRPRKFVRIQRAGERDQGSMSSGQLQDSGEFPALKAELEASDPERLFEPPV